MQLSRVIFFSDLRHRQMLTKHVLQVRDIDSIPSLYYIRARARTHARSHARTHARTRTSSPSSPARTCYVVLSFCSGVAARDSSCHLLPVTSRQCEPSAAVASLFLAPYRRCRETMISDTTKD